MSFLRWLRALVLHRRLERDMRAERVNNLRPDELMTLVASR